MIKVSIIVCTYNRADILADCLDSLINQTVSGEFYEVIVVNNNSTDSTLNIAERYAKNHKNFRVVTEIRQGLSIARNRGFKESKYDWVSYIDDDAKAYPNYVERMTSTIEKYNFDCFGGMYYPWYRNTERPRWLSEKFGQSVKHKEQVALLDNGSITGNVCVFRKKPLEEIGGFSEDLGMSGERIGYGEETFVQFQLQERGYSVGFDPELCILHQVHPSKMKVSWHIKSAFATGRDSVKIFSQTKKIGFLKFVYNSIKLLTKNFYRATKDIIYRNDYYLQNFLLD
ncbi:MAG: glycosyltransferase family 2 protein, partial [Enterococcus sp.]|nr:glycosyltransferase family 2 protein [Enterococcus sp.]